MKPKMEAIGETDGYEMVTGLSSVETDDDFGSDWVVPKSQNNDEFTLSMRALNDDMIEVIHGFEWSRQFAKPEKEFLLMRRENVRNAEFIVLYEPHRGESRLTRFERVAVTTANRETVDSAVGLKLELGGEIYGMILNPEREVVMSPRGETSKIFIVTREQ